MRTTLVLAAVAAAAIATLAGVQSASGRTSDGPSAAVEPGCALASAKGRIQRVIYIQFDNTHFLRDNPNVPSDLEQMPHLLNFIRGNGTLLTNDHTVLISHTAGGILSSLTGVYPDRHGQIVSNSNVRFNGAGFQFPSSFGYWTDPVVANAPTVPNMVTPDGTNAPAPWVPYTRAGCDFGAVATANTVLENTGTGTSGDVTKVFGNPSPQFTEAVASNSAPSGTAARAKAQTDFVGLAIHCAVGSAACAAGHPDQLPDEPGGYAGFKGLFGAQEINPFLTGGPTLNDTAGNPITDPFGQPGFPGFDGMYAATSLAYVAAMQEKGIPITFAYISDAHDFHGVSGNAHIAFGPGSQGYVDQLHAYDQAFAAFFQRLAADGINRNNTLFVFTVDEGDHFAGVQKTGCDGVTTPCVYGPNEVGEINGNIKTLMQHQFPAVPYNWTVHGDSAPTFYVSGNPDPASAGVRALEHAAAGLTAVSPYTGATDTLMKAVATRTEMKTLHMYTNGDPLRDPTFAYFADPNYFPTDFPSSTCETCINPAFAWNHGDIQPEIASTWLGLVGPGVKRADDSEEGDSESPQVWSDHTDVQPTMLTLLGLQPDYQPDGSVLVQALSGAALPQSLREGRGNITRLQDAYRQLNAPFGRFGMETLKASTHGVVGDDATYASVDSAISTLTAQRDALAAQIRDGLFGAEFLGHPVREHQARTWTTQADTLIAAATALGG
jgi:hypothetical protein